LQSEAIFPRVSIIFNTLLSVLSKILYTGVVKFPAMTLEQENFISVRCHLQNGVHIVHRLWIQTGYSWTVPDLGCEQDGEEQSIPFL
jgi:hypothetical protein